MKSKLVIAALMVMTTIILASLSSAMAEGNFAPGILCAANKGTVWYFDTKPFYSGKDVNPDSVVAEYWLTGVAGEEPIIVHPDRVSLADSQVKIFFDTTILPDNAAKNLVSVTLNDGATTFVATGPGWAWGGIR
jgi:hypothetical protein